MLELILQFILKYKFIILFYLVVIILLMLKRKKLDFQAKFIILYRMKWGLKWMEKYSLKFREWIILLGYIGVGGGFIGLILISYVLIKNLYDLLVVPDAISGVSLVLPGIKVPGFGVLPFWYWLIAIFVIAVVHEFSHGIVARAHSVEVKNTGIVLLGPIIGAFVEPNENKLRKEKDIIQYSILTAGAFSNILLAVTAIILLSIVFTPIQQSMVQSTGFTFDSYVDESLPFAKAGILPGTVIIGFNDESTADFQKFSTELNYHRPGESIVVKTEDRDYIITLAAHPEEPKKGYLGIKEIRNEFVIKEGYSAGIGKIIYYTINWWNGFLRWLFLLSLGIGLFNLLPLPIVDGGRMAQVFLYKLNGPLQGEKRYRQISLFFILILLANLFFPLFSKLF